MLFHMENPDFPSDTAIEGKNISRESTFPSEGRTVLEKRKGGQTEKQQKSAVSQKMDKL